MRRFILATLIVIFVTMGFESRAVVPVVASPWTTTTNLSTARTGLSVYSKAEVDGAIETIVVDGGGVSQAYVTNYVYASTNGFTPLVYTNITSVVYTNVLPGLTNYVNSVTNGFTPLVYTNITSVVYTNVLPGLTNYVNNATNYLIITTNKIDAVFYNLVTNIGAGSGTAYIAADVVVSNSLIAGLAAGSYSDGSTTGASHTNNVNWNTAVFVSTVRGDDATGKRANPLRPFASIAAANAAAISFDTIVVTDGTFSESIVPRQNIPFYFSYGTVLLNAFYFVVPNSITNVTISGQGDIGITLTCTSTNILHLKMEGLSISGSIQGALATGRLRCDSFTGFIIGGPVNLGGITPNDISIAPLTIPEAAVSLTPGNVVHPLNLKLFSCTTANESVFTANSTIRFYGGGFADYFGGHSGTFIFNNTRIDGWAYDTDPVTFGATATVSGSYYVE